MWVHSYAIVDVETTGLDPHTCSVCEVAVICAEMNDTACGEPSLVVSSTFSSLVRPRTELAASEIHGITAEDLGSAPRFPELAPALVDLLDGRVLVGHNIAFDLAFLREEFARSGYELVGSAAECVCTMLGSWVYLDVARHTLSEVARAVGAPLHEHHRARGDAEGALAAFEHFLRLERHAPASYPSVHTRRGQYARAASWAHARPVSFSSEPTQR